MLPTTPPGVPITVGRDGLRRSDVSSSTVTALFIAILLAAAFHVYAIWEIGRFYASHVPHYDSVGTLTYGFRILETYRNEGWAGAFRFVASSQAATAMSLTQAYFVAIFAPILEPSPASLQLYNSLASLLAMLSIVVLSLRLGLKGFVAGASCALYLVPDGLWWWYFGLLDYRRDAAMLGLLTASVLLMIAAFVDRDARRRRVTASAFGVAVGLTVLSRDSAALYVMGLVGVPGAAILIWRCRQSDYRFLDVPIIAFVAAAPFLMVLAFHFDMISRRLLDPLLAFGAGAPAFASALGNVDMLSGVTLGLLATSPFEKTYVLTPALVALVMVLPWMAVAVTKRPSRRAVDAPDDLQVARRILFLTGCWCVIFVYGLLTLYIGWRPNSGFLTRMPPFLPLLVGMVCLLLLPFSHLARAARRPANVAAALFLLSVAALVPPRVAQGGLDEPEWIVRANRDVAALAEGRSGSPARFAELWFEAIRIPAADYEAARLGRQSPARTFFVLDGWTFDTVYADPPDPILRNRMLAVIDETIRCATDYVIVTTDLSAYADEESPLLIFRRGQDLVAGLLRDLPDRALTIATPPGQPPIVVLDNTKRPACRSPDARDPE